MVPIVVTDCTMTEFGITFHYTEDGVEKSHAFCLSDNDMVAVEKEEGQRFINIILKRYNRYYYRFLNVDNEGDVICDYIKRFVPNTLYI